MHPEARPEQIACLLLRDQPELFFAQFLLLGFILTKSAFWAIIPAPLWRFVVVVEPQLFPSRYQRELCRNGSRMFFGGTSASRSVWALVDAGEVSQAEVNRV
jgi:hypothetical protein